MQLKLLPSKQIHYQTVTDQRRALCLFSHTEIKVSSPWTRILYSFQGIESIFFNHIRSRKNMQKILLEKQGFYIAESYLKRKF